MDSRAKGHGSRIGRVARGFVFFFFYGRHRARSRNPKKKDRRLRHSDDGVYGLGELLEEQCTLNNFASCGAEFYREHNRNSFSFPPVPLAILARKMIIIQRCSGDRARSFFLSVATLAQLPINMLKLPRYGNDINCDRKWSKRFEQFIRRTRCLFTTIINRNWKEQMQSSHIHSDFFRRSINRVSVNRFAAATSCVFV